MTALKKYERLEASGLWRASPDEQRREVIVKIGEATLTITDTKEQPLAHWSLAAVQRQNPGDFPAIFFPDGDPGETLEIAEDETAMLDAIARLRRAIDRSRSRPGRLRFAGSMTFAVIVVLLLAFWLPDMLRNHALNVVPDIQREAIGKALLGRIERVAGVACGSAETTAVLARLAKRAGARRVVVLPAGVADSRNLPGGVILLNKSLIEDYEGPAVAAGYILSETVQAKENDPLERLLSYAGPVASFRLLTTGKVTQDTLDSYAEWVLISPRPQIAPDLLLAAFKAAQLPSSPYAYARDVTGESVLELIEADPMAGRDTDPILPDREWVQLQNICGG
ncbi:hypothetical protein AB9K34_02810 [Sedimentitalea sp. XS_ASV28]|uniref:hypothetical protein n=1 Tax=Sedimentitalea sp. XS_ASV28 TaxID=3241296 RepID=UPI003512D4AF